MGDGKGSLPLGRRQINLNINYLLAANNTYTFGARKWFACLSIGLPAWPQVDSRKRQGLFAQIHKPRTCCLRAPLIISWSKLELCCFVLVCSCFPGSPSIYSDDRHARQAKVINLEMYKSVTCTKSSLVGSNNVQMSCDINWPIFL